jgi:hypothetical protein
MKMLESSKISVKKPTCYMVGPINIKPKEEAKKPPKVTCYAAGPFGDKTEKSEAAPTTLANKKPTVTCYMPPPPKDGNKKTEEPVVGGLTSEQKMNRLILMQEKGEI